MENYEGSLELDVDLELLSVYEKRLERAIRVKDKARKLARHHKVFLSDVRKLHENLDRCKVEAQQTLEQKKRSLVQAIERRFEAAVDAVDDEIAAKKQPLEQAVADIKQSSAVLTAALETLEDKLKEPQHDFIQRFVPMIEEIESHVSHALSLRGEYDQLVDDSLSLVCVDDFCRLSVRHRTKSAAPAYSPGHGRDRTSPAFAARSAQPPSKATTSECSCSHPCVKPRQTSPDVFLSKKLDMDGHDKQFLQRPRKDMQAPLGNGRSKSDAEEGRRPRDPGRHACQPRTEHLKALVHEAYGELDDLYTWLRQHSDTHYGIAGSTRVGAR